MVKGLLIMLLVFAVVGILGWMGLKLGNASEEKKGRYRKYFMVLYGVLLIAQGGVTMWEDQELKWLAVLNLLLGAVFLWVSFHGKPNPSKKTTAKRNV